MDSKNDLCYDKNGKIMYFQFNGQAYMGIPFICADSIINMPMSLSISRVGYEDNCYPTIEFKGGWYTGPGYHGLKYYDPKYRGIVSKLEWTVHINSLKMIIHIRNDE